MKIAEVDLLKEGIKTNYIEAGEGDSILLLHGWGSNIGLFQQLIGHLSRAHRVFALDMPGFGETEEPKEPWCVDDYVAVSYTHLWRVRLFSCPNIEE